MGLEVQQGKRVAMNLQATDAVPKQDLGFMFKATLQGTVFFGEICSILGYA